MNDVRQRRLRVLHIIYGLGAGGAEALLYRLVTRPSEIEHEVVSLVAPDWYSSELEQKGIKLHHLCIHSSASALRALPRLWRIVRESRADAVQTWMYRSNVYGGLVARLQGKPVVWGIHTGSLRPLRFAARFWAYAGGVLARWVPNFVINCSSRSADIHLRLGYGRAPGAVIQNGYDADAFFPDSEARARTRESLAIEPDVFLVGTVARWHKQKDIPNLLRSVRRVRDAGVPIRCIMVGTGLDSSNDELVELIRQVGCEDVAMPLGRRSDVADLARALDLHVLASGGGEAFPNAVAETMLSGTPNAVTDVGDMAIMVGETGWVVPPEDSNRLAGAILDAFRERKEQPAEWESRRSLARQQIVDNFTFERMAEAYENAWERVVECSRSRGWRRADIRVQSGFSKQDQGR